METCMSTKEQVSIFNDAALDEEFRTKGYVVRPLISREEAASLIDFHQARVPEHAPKDSFGWQSPDQYFTVFWKEDLRREFHDGISAVLRPHLEKIVPSHRVCLSSFVSKRPKGTQARVPLHQDLAFVDPGRQIAVHAWVPMVDVDEKSGCLKIIPGSHRLKHIGSTPMNPSPWDNLRDVMESEFMTPIPMAAGSVLIYDGRLLHASDQNMSDDWRIATNSIMIPRGVAPRIYYWSPPTTYSILEVTDEYFIGFDYLTPMPQPFPSGVKKVGSVEYEIKQLRLEDIEHLRPPRANRRSWFGNLLGRLAGKLG